MKAQLSIVCSSHVILEWGNLCGGLKGLRTLAWAYQRFALFLVTFQVVSIRCLFFLASNPIFPASMPPRLLRHLSILVASTPPTASLLFPDLKNQLGFYTINLPNSDVRAIYFL